MACQRQMPSSLVLLTLAVKMRPACTSWQDQRLLEDQEVGWRRRQQSWQAQRLSEDQHVGGRGLQQTQQELEDGGPFRLPNCSTYALPPMQELPTEHACSRNDLRYSHPCALLARAPPSLSEKQLRNAKLHADRMIAIDAELPVNAAWVEAGTAGGAFAHHVVSSRHPRNSTILDIDDEAIQNCRQRVAKRCTRTEDTRGTVHPWCNMHCLQGDSKQLLKQLDDDSLDLIYVDAAHEYLPVCEDLEAARTKVKVGGLMVANDYVVFFAPQLDYDMKNGEWRTWGVVHAV